MTVGSETIAAPRARVRRAGVRRWGRPALVLAGLSAALAVVSVLAVLVGEEPIAPADVLGMALQWLPIHPARTWSDLDLTIVTQVRLPRVFTAILVGGALATAGTAFQALFRNPLADPGIVGTSAGASMGAIIALMLPVQVVWLGYSFVSLAAFAGAFGTMLLVYALARVGGRLPSTTLLLAGFAVSAIFNALSALIETLGDRLREMYIWLLGDEQAHYLGLRVTQRRLLILVLGSLLTSVAVALGGLIAFVGLLVPHIARLLFGANHRLLLPASLLLGSIFLLVVDVAARMLLQPQELPVGVVTALVGAPWFLALLRRKRGEYTF